MGKKKEKKKFVKKKLILRKIKTSNKKINNNKEIKNKDDDNLCIICLSNYDNNHKIKTLKCNHTLCENCFEQWYKIKESCPVCRRNLFPHPSDRPDFYQIVNDLYLHHDTYFYKQY